MNDVHSTGRRDFLRFLGRSAIAVAATAPTVALLTSGAAHAGAGSDRLHQNESLGRDSRLVSGDGRYAALLQGDGNLVVYGPAGPIWSSNTSGRGGDRITMQSDGNLVMYAGGAVPFATNTRGGNPSLVLQNDGNLVVYTSAGPVWASKDSSERAVQWFYDHMGSGHREGQCELAVEEAFGTRGRYATARANWIARQQQFPYGAAPRGGLVFYSTSSAGHVAVSLGNGQVVSTSVGGRIGIASIGHFQNPLGWARAPW
jgi:hypothetical protein